jgi:hypothetical protein
MNGSMSEMVVNNSNLGRYARVAGLHHRVHTLK